MKNKSNKQIKIVIVMLIFLTCVFLLFSCSILSGILNKNIQKKEISLFVSPKQKIYDGTKKAKINILSPSITEFPFRQEDFVYKATYNKKDADVDNFITVENISFANSENNKKYVLKFPNRLSSKILKREVDLHSDLECSNVNKYFDDTDETINFSVLIKNCEDSSPIKILNSRYDSKEIGKRKIIYSISIENNDNFIFKNNVEEELHNRWIEGEIFEHKTELNSVYYSTFSRQNKKIGADDFIIKIKPQDPSTNIIEAKVKNITVNSDYISIINNANYSSIILKNKLLNTLDIGEINDVFIKLSSNEEINFKLRTIKKGYLLQSKSDKYSVLANENLTIKYKKDENLKVKAIQIDDDIIELTNEEITLNEALETVTLSKNLISKYDSKKHRLGLIYKFDYPFGKENGKKSTAEFTTYFDVFFNTGIIKNFKIERKSFNSYDLILDNPTGTKQISLYKGTFKVGDLNNKFSINFKPEPNTFGLSYISNDDYVLKVTTVDNKTIENPIKIPVINKEEFFNNKINFEGKSKVRIIESKKELYKLAASMYSELQFANSNYKTSNEFLSIEKKTLNDTNQLNEGYKFKMHIKTKSFITLFNLNSDSRQEILNNYVSIIGTHYSGCDISYINREGYSVVNYLEIYGPKTDLYNMKDSYKHLYDTSSGGTIVSGNFDNVFTINKDSLKLNSYTNYEPKAKKLYKESDYLISNEIDLYLALINKRYPKVAPGSLAERELKKAIEINSKILSPEMSDIEKIVSIADYIQIKYHYDQFLVTGDTSKIANNSNPSYTAAGLLSITPGINETNVAVCNGIALTFAILTRLEAIDTIEYNGKAGKLYEYFKNGLPYYERGGHAWAKVKLGDYGYFFDLTWNMPINSSGTQGFRRLWMFQSKYIYENIANDLYYDDNAHIQDKTPLNNILVNDIFFNLYANITLKNNDIPDLENNVFNLFISNENKANEILKIKNTLITTKKVYVSVNLGALTFNKYTNAFNSYYSEGEASKFLNNLSYSYSSITQETDYAVINKEIKLK